MYVDEPPKDGNIPDFNISKIDICPFRACQRSFRLFQGNFSKDIHLRSRLLCFTQNDHTGHAGFKICPFLKWAQLLKTKKVLSTSFQKVLSTHHKKRPPSELNIKLKWWSFLFYIIIPTQLSKVVLKRYHSKRG